MFAFNHPDLEDSMTLNKTFNDLNLPSFYVKCLASLEYNKPTSVQYHTISLALKNTSPNLIVQSKSGTGKTLSFTSIAINKIYQKILRLNQEKVEQQSTRITSKKKASILILQPTRQLAVQVYQFIRKVLASEKAIKTNDQQQLKLKSIMRNINISLSIGGLPIEDDKKNYLQIGYDIVVGTVGRISELVNKNILKLDQIKGVVFDEGDKLFEQKDSIKKVKAILSKTIKPQILIYSATYNQKVFEQLKSLGEFTFVKTVALTGEVMNVKIIQQLETVNVQQGKNDLGLSNVTKLSFTLQSNEKSIFSQKLFHLKEILHTLNYKKCLIFVQKKAQISQVHDYLKQLNPLLIHGSLSQSSRIKLLNQLNYNKIIITSDLLARGIDILVDLIILFNATEGENFWHRIGRTGRIGRKGLVISLDKIDNWQNYTKEIAQKALEQVIFEEKIETFGQYMTQVGKWYDVDHEFECKNINNYKYFDEEKFKAEMLIQISEQQNMDTMILQINNDQDKKQQKIIQCVQEDKYDWNKNIQLILKCKICREQMNRIHQLTGYQFQLLKFL